MTTTPAQLAADCREKLERLDKAHVVALNMLDAEHAIKAGNLVRAYATEKDRIMLDLLATLEAADSSDATAASGTNADTKPARKPRATSTPAPATEAPVVTQTNEEGGGAKVNGQGPATEASNANPELF